MGRQTKWQGVQCFSTERKHPPLPWGSRRTHKNTSDSFRCRGSVGTFVELFQTICFGWKRGRHPIHCMAKWRMPHNGVGNGRKGSLREKRCEWRGENVGAKYRKNAANRNKTRKKEEEQGRKEIEKQEERGKTKKQRGKNVL